MKTKSAVFGSFLGAAVVVSAATAAWANPVSLLDDGNGGFYINMPATGTSELTVPEGVSAFKLYDDRGPNNVFSPNCNGNLVLTVPENHLIRLNGTMEAVQSNGMSSGGFIVYSDQISESDIVIEEYGNANIKWLSTANKLILNFKNIEGRSPSAGLDLTVSVVDPSDPFMVDIIPVDGGSVVSSVSQGVQGTEVSVTATAAEGYVFDHIEVNDERGNPVAMTGGTWLTGTTGSFAMPATNAVVTPIFVAENVGPRVDMPWNGIARYTIADELSVFGVYDYQYSENFECGDYGSPLVLTAPAGYVFMLREQIGGQYYGSSSGFMAFDGDFEDPVGTFAEQMSYAGITSGRTLTLVHKPTCDEYGKIGIRLLDANIGHDVVISSSGEGSVGDNLQSVQAGSRINLTATPAEGYMVNRVSVNAIADHDWWPVRVSGGTWYTSNDYSFTMPYANAEVEVEFVEKKTTADEGLLMEMPRRDSVLAAIPEDVESFNITGACEWSEACRGTLVLAAPEGAKFQMSGLAELDGENVSMTIFDGSIANALHQLELNRGRDIDLNSSGDTLTLRYQSRESVALFDLQVTVFNPNRKYKVMVYDGIEYGTVLADVEEASAGDTVTLTATPDDGYLLDGFFIGRQDNFYEYHFIGGRWYNNTAKFVMPAANVAVAAKFAEPDDGNAEFFTFIPTTDTLRLEIPSRMGFFTVRTEVNEDWEYFNNSNGVLEITAPEGYVIGVEGYMEASDNGDVVTIYDGIGENAEKLLEFSDGAVDETFSTGHSMTIQFKSDASGTDEGLKLYVAVLKKTEMAAITVQEFSNGFKYAKIDGNYMGDDAIDISEDIEVDNIGFIREYTPGAYSTITLPFDYDMNYAWGFSEVLEFVGIVEENGKKSVGVSRVWCEESVAEECSGLDGKLKANTPYIFKAEYSSATFESYGPITLKKTEDAVVSVDGWEFRGTFARKTWQAGDPDLGKVYGFAAGSNGSNVSIGTFVKAKAGAWINPLRAYLKNNKPAKASAPSYAAVGRNEETDEYMDVVIVSSIKDSVEKAGQETTVIGRFNTITGEFIQNRSYDLKGRKVNGTPKAKGMYVRRKK